MRLKNTITALAFGFFSCYCAQATNIERNTTIDVTIDQDADDDPEKAESIVQTALQYIGTRYRAGQSSPKGFDCSGFTSYVYKKENLSITRSSRTQYREGTPITQIADLQKGDLVFFGRGRNRHNVGHVGIVTDVSADGNSFKFIHASRTGVKIDNSNSAYYSARYIGARRILDKQ